MGRIKLHVVKRVVAFALIAYPVLAVLGWVCYVRMSGARLALAFFVLAIWLALVTWMIVAAYRRGREQERRGY